MWGVEVMFSGSLFIEFQLLELRCDDGAAVAISVAIDLVIVLMRELGGIEGRDFGDFSHYSPCA